MLSCFPQGVIPLRMVGQFGVQLMVVRGSSETSAPMCWCVPMHPRVPDCYLYNIEELAVATSLSTLMVFEISVDFAPREDV